MKLEFRNVMLTFLLHDFWVADTGTHQTGFERSHSCALIFPAFWFVQFHVKPYWALRALLHSWFLAEAADPVADIRDVAVVVSQHVEGGQVAIHKEVHLVGDVNWHRYGAVDLVWSDGNGDAVRGILVDLGHEARHTFLLRGRRVREVLDGILANLPFIQFGLGCKGVGRERETVVILVGTKEHDRSKRDSNRVINLLAKSQGAALEKPQPEAFLVLSAGAATVRGPPDGFPDWHRWQVHQGLQKKLETGPPIPPFHPPRRTPRAEAVRPAPPQAHQAEHAPTFTQRPLGEF
eukprot:2225012-Pleurochrysis_carterae.AAC.1